MRRHVEGILFVLENQNKPQVLSDTEATSLHIMISYQWGSQEIVKKIASALKKTGYKIWLDIDHMQGSTLQAMAEAVEKSQVVIVCMTRKYKESPACRLEAEYTVKLRKEIIPLMLEANYSPDGWLGILLGSKLYYAFNDDHTFETKFIELAKGLGNKGKLTIQEPPRNEIVNSISKDNPSNWTIEDVTQWLQKENLATYTDKFKDEEMDGTSLLVLASFINKETDLFFKVLPGLQNAFGAASHGTRLRLINALQKLPK